MTSVVILTGSPGTGKTTISTALANQAANGARIESDDFYSMVTRRISPVLPESHAQNATVICAAARAAGAFAQGGYEVFLDGIFGPWFMPLVIAELRPLALSVEYIVLTCDVELAIERGTSRANAPVSAGLVRQMHAAFAELAPYEAHVVAIDGLQPAAVVTEIARRRQRGEFVVDVTS